MIDAKNVSILIVYSVVGKDIWQWQARYNQTALSTVLFEKNEKMI